ncbi:hypothetical protein [Nocardia flavorosea]|uniref:Uncharacterized protein n=1 Tax=Nocardia flavorosea TaxID=53429 RepID=A0A846YEL9_9NOCA|nr:hypothetical protein [Nocardia flavorosea]NKY58076.1 hypothetical protein [Nocardia flavorosea]
MTGFARLLRNQARLYTGLWLWLRRTTDRDSREQRPLTATRGVLALPMAFLAATLIEVVVLHLVIPWAWLSITLAVVSVWSLVFLFAAVVADIAYPHYVTGREVVLRRSGRVVARIPFDRIATVAESRRYNQTATAFADNRLFLAGPDGTTADLTLRCPVTVHIDSLLPSGRIAAETTRISLSLDDPASLRAALNPPNTAGIVPNTPAVPDSAPNTVPTADIQPSR